jgi:hypothetical protein
MVPQLPVHTLGEDRANFNTLKAKSVYLDVYAATEQRRVV